MSEEKQTVSEEELFNAEEEQTETKNCPFCGGRVAYSPADRALKCEYCGRKAQIDLTRYSEELDFYDLLNAQNDTWSAETHVFRCNNCGARAVLSRNDISKKCAFCGTTNVVQTEELCGLKPNAVLPFLLDKKQASEKVVKWAKKKWFAPKKFKESVYPDEIYGNYIPAFTFDSDTVSNYSGRLGKTHTRTKRVNGKTVTETYTQWFPISGSYSMRFDDVLVQASDSIRQKDVNKISPFDTNHSQAYSSEFLQGFSASQYSKTGQECWNVARTTMQERVKQAILSQYDYDRVDTVNVNMNCSNITYKYVLLPVYVGHCNYVKKLYNFFINGQTGKVSGKTPVSAWRVALVALLGVAAAVGLGFLLFYLSA